MDDRTVSRITLIVVLIICMWLLVRAFQAMQLGNNGPLIQFVVSAIVGGLLVVFLGRRRSGTRG